MIFFKCFLVLLFSLSARAEEFVVGSKNFTEGYITAEIISIALENKGHKVKRNFGLGGSLVAFDALRTGEIDVYPEYTGTLAQVGLKKPEADSIPEIRKELPPNLGIMDSLGFNNTFAIAIKKELAKEKGWETISDVANENLSLATNYEFMNREDGWEGFQQTYNTNWQTIALEHSLAYKALVDGVAQMINVYSTDAKIKTLKLKVLEDDKNYFPTYLAIPFYNQNKGKEIRKALKPLIGSIDRNTMIQMNAMVEEEGKTFSEVASWFYQNHLGDKTVMAREVSWFSKHWELLKEHLILTFSGLFLSCMFSFIATFFMLKNEGFAFFSMSFAGLLQTIPSIALLAFMIPIFGIGLKAAITALFLYSILPVLRNTYIAFKDFDPVLEESARAMGLYPWERLVYIKLPIVMPIILAGVKTAAIISIGTATLAAFIGAGGLGEPIVTGLALNNTGLILQGAIPAALLALVTEFSFSALEKYLEIKKS